MPIPFSCEELKYLGCLYIGKPFINNQYVFIIHENHASCFTYLENSDDSFVFMVSLLSL